MRAHRHERTYRGFTGFDRGFALPEIMIAVVIVLILSAIAFPSIRGLTLRSELTSAAEHFAADLGHIRAEAVKRNAPITVTFESPDRYTADFLGTRQLHRAQFQMRPDSIRFGPFGPPLTGGATFVLANSEFQTTVVLTGAGFAQVE